MAADDEFIPENTIEQRNAADDEFVPENAAEQSNATEQTNTVEENDATVESEGEEEEAGAKESGEEEEEAFEEEVLEKRVNPNMELKNWGVRRIFCLNSGSKLIIGPAVLFWCRQALGYLYKTLQDMPDDLWDSNEHKFNDHIRVLRKKALLPLCRILPQLLKHIGYYICNPVSHKYTEWPLYFPLNSANKLHQRDSVSCGLLALKSIENRLIDTADKMMYKKNLPEWRAHIAKTIYNYSTHESTIAH
ncbi:hypothetical protein OROMI_019078 [Orobanche minor]